MVAAVPLTLLSVAAAVFAYRLKNERIITFWLLWSGLIHILLEGLYGLYPEVVTARSTTTFMEFMLQPAGITDWFDPRWWSGTYAQYARYDGRYAVADPLVVYFCYTEWLLGPMCFLVAWMIHAKSRWRHPTQLVLCTAQFYGTVLYFLSPILYGTWDEMMTHDTFELIVFVISLNGLWMIMPAIMMVQSFRVLGRGQGS